MLGSIGLGLQGFRVNRAYGVYGGIWGYMGVYGGIWGYMGVYGGIWGYMSEFEWRLLAGGI